MSETYLVLLAGALAGLAAAFVGIIILYRNRLQTDLTLRERVEQERTALQEDIAEIDKEELAETDAGKELMLLSRASDHSRNSRKKADGWSKISASNAVCFLSRARSMAGMILIRESKQYFDLF